MRTYSASAYRSARVAWAEGDYGPEWAPWYRLAVANGIIFPPDGTRWDSWEDEQPSQRAIVYRAIGDSPELLRRSIVGSRSWGEVVGRLIRGIEDVRERAAIDDEDEAWQRGLRSTHRDDVLTLGRIVERLRDSV